MKRIAGISIALPLVLTLAGILARAQAHSGPISPKPGVELQQAPKDMPKVRVQVALVNTPVTVRDSRGEMVHNLEARDFQIADNGVAQQISHFDMGGDPISLVILIETSSRIEALLPQVRKTGILFTQTVMGPNDEAAVVGFNDSVDRLLDFTTNGDLIENTIAHLGEGTSGSKLYDAMAVGVEMLSGRPEATADKPGRRRVLMILSEATGAGSGNRRRAPFHVQGSLDRKSHRRNRRRAALAVYDQLHADWSRRPRVSRNQGEYRSKRREKSEGPRPTGILPRSSRILNNCFGKVRRPVSKT